MSSVAGATTVVGDFNYLKPTSSPDFKSKHKPDSTLYDDAPAKGPFHPVEEILEETRPFFVKITAKDGVIGALKKLDRELLESGQESIMSKKNPTDWIGDEIAPGYVGLINKGGLPQVLIKPGRYPKFPLRWWWAREYCGSRPISDTVLEFQGLTVVQVSQNQAAVISDPQNKIFVIKNGGFVALSLTGTYSILGVIDQTHLNTVVKDKITNSILGYTQEVKMRRNTGSNSGEKEFVVALFMDIPANNCAILQKGDDLRILPAGQHYIVDPNTTLRALFTYGECQTELPTKDIYTRDQVPVSLTIYLKWELQEPLKLTRHGYSSAYDALRDKTQSILTQIMSHLEYSTMVKQRNIGPDNMEDGSDQNSAFLDALRTRAMDEMHEAAKEYGIILKDLAVIDRQFKGEIASTMDKLTTRALQAQVEAANVDRENSNKVKREEGALLVARVQAETRRTDADANAYAVVAAAKAQAEALEIAAQAQAAATRLAALAEADAIRSRAEADGNVEDAFAREMSAKRVEVQRVQAYGDRTVFVPTEHGGGGGIGSAVALGLGMAHGMQEGKAK